MIESDAATAQASAADLGNVTLLDVSAARDRLFQSACCRRSLESLLDRSVANFKKTQTITENAYAAGTALANRMC